MQIQIPVIHIMLENKLPVEERLESFFFAYYINDLEIPLCLGFQGIINEKIL